MSEENKLFIQLVNKTGSQANFCMLTGISKSVCSQYYNCKATPKLSTLKKYAKTIGFEVKNKFVKI